MIGKDKAPLTLYLDKPLVYQIEVIAQEAKMSKSDLIKIAWNVYFVAAMFAASRMQKIATPAEKPVDKPGNKE